MNTSESQTNKAVTVLAYPSVIALGILMHFAMLRYGVDLMAATYGPVVFGAAMVTFLEIQFPHRRVWWAGKSEVLNDAVYMVVVQVVWPRLLTFLLAMTLLDYFKEQGMAATALWPHHWPVAVQAVLMVLTADFFRYWLHRFAHEWPFLWRFHAVHHSPHKLYWVNVGRFHFVDKALQFLFDALPFIILGVGEEVLALYYEKPAVGRGLGDIQQLCAVYYAGRVSAHKPYGRDLVEEQPHGQGDI